MSNEKSAVWRGFDKVERKVGKPLEDVVASERYADVMVRGLKVQRAVGGLAGRVLKGGIGKVLRAVNIPTSTDVQRLSRQLAVLTSEVRTLTMEQHAAKREAATPRAAARPAAKKAPSKAPTRPATKAPAKRKASGSGG